MKIILCYNNNNNILASLTKLINNINSNDIKIDMKYIEYINIISKGKYIIIIIIIIIYYYSLLLLLFIYYDYDYLL